MTNHSDNMCTVHWGLSIVCVCGGGGGGGGGGIQCIRDIISAMAVEGYDLYGDMMNTLVGYYQRTECCCGTLPVH